MRRAVTIRISESVQLSDLLGIHENMLTIFSLFKQLLISSEFKSAWFIDTLTDILIKEQRIQMIVSDILCISDTLQWQNLG